ncbi:MAG: D-arabinono-1,4-lactone oxidase [Hyphomonadaceae bacterium]
MTAWSNWSGSVRAAPQRMARPRTEAELAAIVDASHKVRVAGAGHSFMPLCETDGTLLSLAALDREIAPSESAGRVWAPAGWSLAKLTEALWAQGLSLINQGDVNPQALAGAIATGTHGTGAELGSLSTAARGFRLMLADGSIVTASETEHPDLYQASRLSLGMTGIALAIEIDVLPAYHLEEHLETLPLAEIEERWSELAGSNRHVEFFVFAYGEHALLKRLNVAPTPERPMRERKDDDAAFKRYCDLCTSLPFLTKPLQRTILRPGLNTRRIGPAYRIFPSERTVKFEEMEYELPRSEGWRALKEVIAWIKRKNLAVTFPFEFRLAAADDIWLSPFNAGPGASISMHQYARMPWRGPFADAERIFRAHGGRPHWAKRHTLTRADVDLLYPMAERFRALRASHDSAGKFLNAHLAALFAV